ncbi:MAG: GTP-binding protein [Janthinobacterium lividum]
MRPLPRRACVWRPARRCHVGRHSAPEAGRIPVLVVTGALGSGKTTLIARMLADGRYGRTAVIVNEFGAIGLDHALVASSTETLVQLTTGCLCCVVCGGCRRANAGSGTPSAAEVPARGRYPTPLKRNLTLAHPFRRLNNCNARWPPMPKRGQFLLIVQTAVLANGVSVSSQPELAETYRDEYSAAGVLKLMGEAVAAGERIPDEMTAADAATEFCYCKLRHLKDAREAAGKMAPVPGWLADG